MVAVEHDPAGGCLVIVLSPNVSSSGRQTLLGFGLIAATTVAVAAGFAAMGYWPVLPFAGLEIGLLAWALRATLRWGRLREVIVLDAERVEIDQGGRRWSFDTYWTEAALEPSGHPWYGARLLVRSRGTALSLGQFLSGEERVDLAHKLKRWIGPMGAPGGVLDAAH